MALPAIIRESIQEFPNAKKGEGEVGFWSYSTTRGYILPSWGTRMRERALREWYRHEYNWLGQSAITGLNKKVASTPWEITGKKNVRHFQDVLRQAHFGQGWGQFVKLVLLDYFRQDGGAYIEVIAPGKPTKAPTGKVTGIAHLDSLRCYPTGDPEYPVIYYSRKGTKHLLHHTRVLHLVDAPDGDESNPGYGMCALSRAISIVAQQVHMMRYIEGKLDDKPSPGFAIASGITKGQRDTALSTFIAEQGSDTRPEWGKTVWFFSLDPSQQIKLDYITFAQAPEGWSAKEYTDLHVNAWAAALGTDVQEIWQLSGGTLGSGAQSEILHAKSQGKTFGDVLTSLERGLNDVLPESLEMAFKRRDPYDEQERATTAGLWAGVALSVGDNMTPEEKRQMLANQVEPIKDAITDENGEIQRLPDVDVAPENEDTTVDDATPQTAATTDTQEAPVVRDDAKKEIADTRADFEREFNALLGEARDDSTNRRSYSIRLRDLLRRAGKAAYEDGLQAGGVSDGLDSTDSAVYARLLAQQSAFVSGFSETLFADGISDGAADGKAQLWANKSLEVFYYAGLASSDINGTYQFVGDDGLESCVTCRSLKNSKHRLRWWVNQKLRPRVDTANFVCKGFRCQHRLEKVTGAA